MLKGMRTALLLVSFTVFAASLCFGQQVKGESEGKIDAGADSFYYYHFWFESFRNDKVIFYQRFYPSKGRMPRWEAAGGTMLGLGPLVLKPFAGWAREGTDYLLLSATSKFSFFGHEVDTIHDGKIALSGSRSGFLFQKVYVYLNYHDLWGRWEGIVKEGRFVASQPGLEWRGIKLNKNSHIFVAAQYDHVVRKVNPFTFRTGIRFQFDIPHGKH